MKRITLAHTDITAPNVVMGPDADSGEVRRRDQAEWYELFRAAGYSVP